MIKLSWRRGKQMINPRLLKLETAKDILEEVFHARPSGLRRITGTGTGLERRSGHKSSA